MFSGEKKVRRCDSQRECLVRILDSSAGKLVLTDLCRTNGGPVLPPSMKRTLYVSYECIVIEKGFQDTHQPRVDSHSLVGWPNALQTEKR